MSVEVNSEVPVDRLKKDISDKPTSFMLIR